MTQRDVLFVILGVLAAAVVSLLLFVAVLARPGGRPNVVVGRPVPTAQPITVAERRIPQEFRALLAPLLPLERNLSDAGREAATILLVVLVTGGAWVLGRDQVAKIRASAAGDAAEQLRILGIGVGVLIAAGCALFLAAFVLLRVVIGLAPQHVALGLQTILSTIAVVLLLAGIAALLGFTATAWRLGSWLFGLAPWRTIGARVPPGIAALTAAALIVLLAETPIVGRLLTAILIAYSLGAFVRMRLVRTEARPAP